jgi:hypothetical protein
MLFGVLWYELWSGKQIMQAPVDRHGLIEMAFTCVSSVTQCIPRGLERCS